MAEAPEISVLMPAYNSAKFIAAAIKSVQAQTFRSWELLVLDDASKDETAAIAAEFAAADPRIKIIRNTKNAGISAQLNKGIALSEGRYIARIDSDDLYHPDKLAAQFALHESDRGLLLSTTDYWRFQEDDGARTPVSGPATPEEIRVSLLKNLYLCGPSFFARKEALRDIGFDTTLTVAEDYKMVVEMMRRGKVASLAKPLYHYRCNPASITNTFRGDMDARMLEIQQLALGDIPGLEAGERDAFLKLTGERNVPGRDLMHLRKAIEKIQQAQAFDNKLLQQLIAESWQRLLITQKLISPALFTHVLSGYRVFGGLSARQKLGALKRVMYGTLNGA